MLVNKTVEFFLSEVAGRGEMPAEGWAETGARFRRSNHRGRQRDVTAANRCWVEADAGGAEAGTGSGRARCWWGPGLGRQRNLQSPR